MEALLIQHDLLKALQGFEGLSKYLSNDKKNNNLLDRTRNAILLSIFDEVLYEIAGEKTAARLWPKYLNRKI